MLNDLIKPDSEPLVYQQLADAYAALDAGQVDAVLIDTAINLGQAAASKRQGEGDRRSSLSRAAPTSTVASCRRARPTSPL